MSKRQSMANSSKKALLRVFRGRETGVLMALIVLVIALSFLAKNFLSMGNIFSILRAVSFEGIAALGMMLVMITGGLDLSIASNMALSGILVSLLMVSGVPVFPAVLIAIVAGMGIGLVNGLIITRIRLGPIITTLGMMSVVRGVAFMITKGLPVVNLPSSFTALGQGLIGGVVPVPIVFFLAVAIVIHLIQRYTVFGYQLYATGGNEVASRYSGVQTAKVTLLTYVLAGALGALGGVLLIARLGVAQPSIASGYEMAIIAAVIIGGTSLNGGIGTVLGTVLGVLIIGVIRNGLVLANIGGYYIQFANGLLILTAVVINRLRGIQS
ncbi:ABC transporter permease [Candidatus Bipolaricaulota bacterium]|nr:ABC transporter permease [Candidatus Bipolaricaulota bacterium]